jgi:purine-nucleoside phosphorylase
MKSNDSISLEKSLNYIQSRINIFPRIGIILGSGLGRFVEELQNKKKISTSQIPYFPLSTVEGHKGNLVFGNLDNIPLLVVQGRTHLYEGYKIQEVVFVVRIMAGMGIQLLIVTNAAGSVNSRYKPGDFMIIADHINFMFQNPLRGPVLNKEQRWPDMFNVYDETLSFYLEKTAIDLGLSIKKGILFASSGPTYETAAEVQMAKNFGADAVSMSTVPEVIIARANLMKVVGISCITNMATGLSQKKLSHAEVTHIAKKVQEKFRDLLKAFIQRYACIALEKIHMDDVSPIK